MVQNITKIHKIGTKNMYRLVVDGDLHKKEEGWRAYALREPNCLTALLGALTFGLSDLDKPLSVDMIKEIHRIATTDVQRMPISPGEFRENPTAIPLIADSNMNQKGLGALYKKITENDNQYNSCIAVESKWYLRAATSQEDFYERLSKLKTSQSESEIWSILSADKLEKKGYYRPPEARFIPQLMNDAVESCNKAIAAAKSDDEKLTVIATHIQMIEQLHPFPDANLRTCVVLLQRLLIQNGFLPTMLNDPNQFDAYDVDTLVKEIKVGMDRTQQLIANPDAAVFDYVTPDNIKPVNPYDPDERVLLNKTQEAQNTIHEFSKKMGEELSNKILVQKNIFTMRLNLLQDKIDDLRNRYELASENKDPKFKEELNLAVYTAENLYKNLSASGDAYFTIPITKESYTQFKNDSSQAIKEARDVLDKHRGWSEFLANLAIGITTLGVGLLIKGVINVSLNQNFFFVHKTDSAKRLDLLQDVVNSSELDKDSTPKN